MSTGPAEIFEEHRSLLIGLAYRLTGSRAEAEDVTQETFLKWFAANRETIESPRAWLTRVATNLALDRLRSARSLREKYVGPWLPEPYVEESSLPENEYELDESVSIALMLVLERLSPAERAAFILHDLFGFAFVEVARILEKAEPACRKLASRAREHVRERGRARATDPQALDRLNHAFFRAIKAGDFADLLAILKDDVTFHADGGGKAAAAPEIMRGAGDVARFLIERVGPGLRGEEGGSPAIRRVRYNGIPGAVLWIGSEPVTAFSFDVLGDGRISHIYALRNPDKLRFFR